MNNWMNKYEEGNNSNGSGKQGRRPQSIHSIPTETTWTCRIYNEMLFSVLFVQQHRLKSFARNPFAIDGQSISTCSFKCHGRLNKTEIYLKQAAATAFTEVRYPFRMN